MTPLVEVRSEEGAMIGWVSADADPLLARVLRRYAAEEAAARSRPPERWSTWNISDRD
jgi:hypothetical protein